MRVRLSRRNGVRAQRPGARRKLVLLLVAATGFAAIAPAAEAAFPGRNGAIAYTAPDAGEGGGPIELWTVEPRSGSTTQLTAVFIVEDPAWSDDGRTLAFSMYLVRRGFAIGAVPGRRPGLAPWTPGDIEAMTLPSPPTSPGDFGHALDTDPSWAPGGRRIVYRDEAGSLIVLGADDSKRVIVAGPGTSGPAWSPNGRLIAFTRCASLATKCALWVVRPNGKGLRRLTDGTMNERAPSWSPDGRRLVFQADTGLWTIRARAFGRRPRPRRLLAAGAGPSWSPDGTQIAFGRDDGVYVVNTDGSSPRQLAPSATGVRNTDWQPKVWPMRIGF